MFGWWWPELYLHQLNHNEWACIFLIMDTLPFSLSPLSLLLMCVLCIFMFFFHFSSFLSQLQWNTTAYTSKRVSMINDFIRNSNLFDSVSTFVVSKFPLTVAVCRLYIMLVCVCVYSFRVLFSSTYFQRYLVTSAIKFDQINFWISSARFKGTKLFGVAFDSQSTSGELAAIHIDKTHIYALKDRHC